MSICSLFCSHVLKQDRYSKNMSYVNLLKGQDPLRLNVELLHCGHQKFFCNCKFILTTIMIIQPAVLLICFRDGNLQSQGKHNVPGIFLKKQNSQIESPKPGLPHSLNLNWSNLSMLYHPSTHSTVCGCVCRCLPTGTLCTLCTVSTVGNP